MNRLTYAALCLLCLVNPILAADCPTDRIDETVSVKYVYDGDTLKLSEGRKIRILGIDAPELEHDRQAGEPLAEQSRDYLRQLIAPSGKLALRHDREQHDRYGRQLSHVFLSDGRNISAELLRKGLATTLILPPNFWAADCYKKVESIARKNSKGVWQLPDFQPQALADLPKLKKSKYLVVSGTVQSTKTRSERIQIVLANGKNTLILAIDSDVQPLFVPFLKKISPGHLVTVKGWVNPHDGALIMHLRHNSAILDLS